MPETWAKTAGPGGPAEARRPQVGGVDLHLDLSGTRVRAALEAALRGAVRDGRLPPRHPAARVPGPGGGPGPGP